MLVTNIREFRDQINVQLPATIRYSIANFSQLSSFEKFPEIIVLLEDIKKFSDSPVAYFDTFEEVEKEGIISKEDWDKDVIFMKEMSEKLEILYSDIMLETKVMREFGIEKDTEDDMTGVEPVPEDEKWILPVGQKYEEEPW